MEWNVLAATARDLAGAARLIYWFNAPPSHGRHVRDGRWPEYERADLDATPTPVPSRPTINSAFTRDNRRAGIGADGSSKA